jgi:ribose 5-phosphate isomerase B
MRDYITPMKRKIAIAADHGGYKYKDAIQKKFDSIEWIDLGTHSSDSVDYPDYAHTLANCLKTGDVEAGILICGTGIGISIAANRHSHIRSALCTDTTMARLTRQHNDANVLALGERIIGLELAFDIVETFLNTGFEGGRHENRICKINQTIA